MTMIFGRNRKVVAKFILRSYFESWHSASLQFKLICYVTTGFNDLLLTLT